MNVETHLTNTVKTYRGRALAIVKAGNESGTATISATIGGIKSNDLQITVK